MERKERLQKVYDYLLFTGRVHRKKDLAAAIGKKATTLSKAFSGDKKALTDMLFKQIAAKYKPIFSLEWLLTGEGDMLNEVAESKAPNPYNIDSDPEQSGADLLIDMFKSARSEKEKAKEIFDSAEKARKESEAIKDENQKLRSEILSIRNEMQAARNSMLEAAADFASAAAEFRASTKQLHTLISRLSLDYSLDGQLAADSLSTPSAATSATPQVKNTSSPAEKGVAASPTKDVPATDTTSSTSKTK